jgi:hypothetical protein
MASDKEVFRAVDINKNSTGTKSFSSYPKGGMKKIREVMKPYIDDGSEIGELGSDEYI